ncbi:MAG: dephospho-CoA kinase [Candidatus Margulisbacteria bacterium]|jgi:dephospho-CoA kinase|nr:dephospho-CoA kinase [Candidatus Margulisiibacteriota bacterium]
MIIGVTGLIGSGKSTAAAFLAGRLGARIIDADKLGHLVLKQNKFVRRGLKIIFGSAGRKVIAAQAFASPLKLFLLNTLTHPFICRRILREIQGAPENLIIDAPLLFQTGLHKYCDRIIFVTADEKSIRHRLAARGYSAEQIDRRLSASQKVCRYKSKADKIFANSGSLAALRRLAYIF